MDLENNLKMKQHHERGLTRSRFGKGAVGRGKTNFCLRLSSNLVRQLSPRNNLDIQRSYVHSTT